MNLKQYFIPPFYLVDESSGLMYNKANDRLELIANFNSEPFRLLSDKEVSILNIKLLNVRL